MDEKTTCQCHLGRLTLPHYVRNQDFLRVGVSTGIADLVVAVSGLMLNEQGELTPFEVAVAPTSDRAETAVVANIGAGWILHAHAHVLSGTLLARGAYVTARIVQNTGTPASPMMTLLAGYLDNVAGPSFPYGVHEPPLAGLGRPTSTTGTDPAAGSEISETVPTGAVWLLRGLFFSLVTDATVATRQVQLRVDNGTNVVFRNDANASQVASLTRTYNFYPFSSVPAASGTEIFGAIPPNLLLPAGYRVRTVTTNLQAGDNFSAPTLLFDEYLAS